jgi:hypothetical protein
MQVLFSFFIFMGFIRRVRLPRFKLIFWCLIQGSSFRWFVGYLEGFIDCCILLNYIIFFYNIWMDIIW